jgi:hypothetical protein
MAALGGLYIGTDLKLVGEADLEMAYRATFMGAAAMIVLGLGFALGSRARIGYWIHLKGRSLATHTAWMSGMLVLVLAALALLVFNPGGFALP